MTEPKKDQMSNDYLGVVFLAPYYKKRPVYWKSEQQLSNSEMKKSTTPNIYGSTLRINESTFKKTYQAVTVQKTENSTEDVMN